MQWKSMFGKLEQYKGEHNHCNVPQKEEGGLDGWVKNQRFAFKKDTLSDERIAMLDSAGFVWTFGREGQHDMQWKSMFGKLEQYKREHNHCNVPRSEKSLGGWVDRQRTAFKENTLSDERIAMLDSAGFVWTFGRWGSSGH